MDESNLYTKNKSKVILEDDPPLNGQSWTCLSFVSPEDVIKDKNGFTVAKFLQSYAKSKDEEFGKLYEEYMNFKYKNEDSINKDFNKEVKNITNIRGIKVRGTYSTQEEARARAEHLHKIDPSFHVFIGTVGQWLPWDPSSDKIEDEVFLNDGLNTLVSEYKKQSSNRDEVFNERMSNIRESKDNKDNAIDTVYDPAIQINTENLESDPWLDNKVSEDPVSEEVVSEVVSEEPVSEEPVSEEPVSEVVSEEPVSEEPVSEVVSEVVSEEPVSEEPVSEEVLSEVVSSETEETVETIQ